MLQEHALRKIEFFLHAYCIDANTKAIIDNIVTAANRGYSFGSYMARGHFVVAPVEDLDQRVLTSREEFLWPFSSETQAHRFLVHLSNYFGLRGTRSDILGIEGFVIR